MTILTKKTGIRYADLIAQETPLPSLYIQHFRFGQFDPTHSWKRLSLELLWTQFDRSAWFNILCDHLFVLWMMLITTDRWVGNYHGGDRSRAKELRLRIEKALKQQFKKTPFVHFDYHAIQSIQENPDNSFNNSTLDLVRKLILDVVHSEEANDPKSQARKQLERINKKCPRYAFKKVEVKDEWELGWQGMSSIAYPFYWQIPGRRDSYFMIPGGENEHPPGWGPLTRFSRDQIQQQDLLDQEGPNREATADEIQDYVERLVRVDPAWTRPNSAARPQISFLMLLSNVPVQDINLGSFRKEIEAFHANSRIVGKFIGSTIGEWEYLFGQLVEPETLPPAFGVPKPIPAASPREIHPTETRGSTARAELLLQAQRLRELPELPEDEPEPTVVIAEEHVPPDVGRTGCGQGRETRNEQHAAVACGRSRCGGDSSALSATHLADRPHKKHQAESVYNLGRVGHLGVLRP